MILKVLQDQSQIGWFHFLRGFFATSWHTLASTNPTNPNKPEHSRGNQRIQFALQTVHEFNREIGSEETKHSMNTRAPLMQKSTLWNPRNYATIIRTRSSSPTMIATGGSGTLMSTESCLHGNCKMQQIRKIHGKKVEKIYWGFVNEIRIPTDKIQHARLHEPSEKKGTASSPVNPTNEGEWIEVKNKAKKVRFMCQDRFGETSMKG